MVPLAPRGEARHDVTRQEVVVAQLHRREVPVGERANLQLEPDGTRGACRPAAEAIDTVALADGARPDVQVGARGVQPDCRPGHVAGVAIVPAAGAPVSHQQASTPSAAGTAGVAQGPADQVGDVPPLLGSRHEVEVVPLAPRAVGDAGEVKPVELVVELLRGGRHVGRVGRGIPPFALPHVQGGAQRGRPTRDLAARTHGGGPAIPWPAEVDQLAFDGRRHGSDEAGVARAAESLPGQVPRPVDAEEHSAQAARPHRLDVDALGKDGDLAAAHERHIAALLQHRLADGEENDHDPHAQGEAEQQEEGSQLAHQEMTEGEREQHQSRMAPSSM